MDESNKNMTGSHSFKVITDKEVLIQALNYKDLILAVEKGLGTFSRHQEGEIVQPVRTVIPVKDCNGFFASMPVYSRVDDIIATKMVSFFPRNTAVPTHNAIVMVFSTQTGVLRAMLDGDIITMRRTAAASAVATKYLAPENSKVLCILGSGTQAKSHFEALRELITFEEVRIWNHRPEGAHKLASQLGEGVQACHTAEEAVRGADVIVTVTSSPTPVLKAEWVKPGAHINAVGACRPDWAEIDPELMRACGLYVDSRAGAVTESGDIIMSGGLLLKMQLQPNWLLTS